jgi:anti-anti-sigma factor
VASINQSIDCCDELKDSDFMLDVHIQKFANIAILCLRGRIGVCEIDALRSAVQSQSGVRAVVLDLDRVVGIDAGGLGALLELRNWAQRDRVELRLMSIGQRVQQVLDMTCLSSVFENSSEAEVLHLATRGRPGTQLRMAHCG